MLYELFEQEAQYIEEQASQVELPPELEDPMLVENIWNNYIAPCLGGSPKGYN